MIRLGSSKKGEFAERWEALAQTLGLDARTSRKQVTMRGELGGRSVRLVADGLGTHPKVKVRFESGLRHLSIRPGACPPTDPTDFITGDPTFDGAFRTRVGLDPQEAASQWLTPHRREVIVGLSGAVHLVEIEEDEIKARMADVGWTDDELIQTVEFCVAAAQQLDLAAGGEHDSVAS